MPTISGDGGASPSTEELSKVDQLAGIAELGPLNPVLIATVPLLVFTGSLAAVVVGVVLWGAANGIQDSTENALVADLLPASRRATAYGLFAAVQGAAAVAGGATAGALYSRSPPALIVVIVASQIVALVLLVVTLRRPR